MTGMSDGMSDGMSGGMSGRMSDRGERPEQRRLVMDEGPSTAAGDSKMTAEKRELGGVVIK